MAQPSRPPDPWRERQAPLEPLRFRTVSHPSTTAAVCPALNILDRLLLPVLHCLPGAVRKHHLPVVHLQTSPLQRAPQAVSEQYQPRPSQPEQ